MARLYSDYIKVDSNFIPVFSRNSDRTYPNKWQSFYPHDSFKRILTCVVETLEKSNQTVDHSIWMSGAYGTGKTYASFVIKHILEDSIESISPYFERNGMSSLLARVKGVRQKGRILVVHRSSSAGINTQDKLFNSIIDSVRQAVQEAGLSYFGAGSISDKILDYLKHPETSAVNFEGLFNKYRAKFTQYSSLEEIISDLEGADVDEEARLELLNTIVEIAAKEGFNWSMSADEVVNWLEDVRKANGLYAIFFIWDEFTEYFKNNQNNITGLQEIAMADSRINCYLFLITHSSKDQLIHDAGARKIIEARFKMGTIELEERTAFKLLAQALSPEPDLAKEWNGVTSQLWGGVKSECADVIKEKDLSIQDADFKNLLPMHPYAAYLLKFIAKDISSNQRTMFQFLSGDYSEADAKKNFKWFSEHFAYEYGKWNYLTVDYLWDYFIASGSVDLNDADFNQALSHYSNYAPLCDDPSNSEIGERRRRILKAALLLAVMQVKNAAQSRTGAISLLRPTQKNIMACFAGTPIALRIVSDLNFFTSKGILAKMESPSETLYVMTSATLNTEKLDELKKTARRDIPFEKLIEIPLYKVSEPFEPKGYLQQRLQIYKVTPNSASDKAKTAKAKQGDNHIAAFFLFAQNEAQQGKVKEAVGTIFREIGERCVVVDFSGQPFTDVLFDNFIENQAKAKYFTTVSKQKQQVDLAERTSKDIVGEWTSKLPVTSLRVYSVPDASDLVVGAKNLEKALVEINAKFYGCGLEEIAKNDKLFNEQGFKASVAQMAMGKIEVPSNYAYVRNISNKLQGDGIWDNEKYWQKLPDHAVSRMKKALNKLIDDSFKKSSRVAVLDIWRKLKEPPFGFLPNCGSVFLIGFLLKEFADSGFYKSDENNNTVALTYEGLSDLIFAAVKENPKAKSQFIVKQTQQQKKFCEVTGAIFKIPTGKRNSVDEIANNIQIYLRNNQYPLWALQYFLDEDGTIAHDENHDAMVTLTQKLCEFLKPEQKIGHERSKIVEEIYSLYKKNKNLGDVYGAVLSQENMRKGMDYYIAQYRPQVVMAAKKLEIGPQDYIGRLNSKMSIDSPYLWEIGDTNAQIDNLWIDLEFICAINGVLAAKQQTEDAAKKELIKKLNIVKVPQSLLKELQPDLMPLFELFNQIRGNAAFNKREAVESINAMADSFNSFFNNQMQVFRAAVDHVLNTAVSDDEYQYLFNHVQSGILFKATDEFSLGMRQELDKFRKEQKSRQIAEAWTVATQSETPARWSEANGIPVLCMFTDDIVRAQKVFSALNRTSQLTSEDIDDALEFLRSGKLDVLQDKSACERRFIEFFAGDYAYVVDSAEALREVLRAASGPKVYDWYAKAENCKEPVRRFAREQYQQKFCSKAKDRVRRLSAEEAQKYLGELIDGDPLLGIRILKG